MLPVTVVVFDHLFVEVGWVDNKQAEVYQVRDKQVYHNELSEVAPTEPNNKFNQLQRE